jgi:RNA polymerase sigma factor (sigma-70 family)
MGRSDADLIRAAAQGDAASLGALLQRHHAALLGVAVTLVGHDDAEDVVHDAFLVALRRIGDLRDPSAAGAWLRAIVRTQCLMRLRARHEEPVEDLHDLAGSASDAVPTEELERLALRDWVWSALERLTEPLRVVTILRYFGTRSSYQEIAAIVGVPVGTVRSRLNQVRLKLPDRLLEEASSAHPDIARTQATAERYFREAVADVNRGELAGYTHTWADDVLGHEPNGPNIRGRDELVRAMHDDTVVPGVLVHLDRVIASPTITVLEARLESPAEAPSHCPPATTQVHFHPHGYTDCILFAFPSPEPQTMERQRG